MLQTGGTACSFGKTNVEILYIVENQFFVKRGPGGDGISLTYPQAAPAIPS